MKHLLLSFLLLHPLFINAQIITTVAGNGTLGHTGDGGPAISAECGYPGPIAFDNYGSYYFSDASVNVIRKVDTTGIISTVAGGGISINGIGDNGPATDAVLNNITGIAFDALNNMYISDGWNNRIRKIDAQTGIITTIAGNGIEGYSGDGGPATAAMLSNPWEVCLDNKGNIYIADLGNYRIRKIDSSGIITTIAGNGSTVFSGEGGQADSAGINSITGLCMDKIGNLYLADRFAGRVLKIDTAGVLTTIAGNGLGYNTGDGGPAINAQINPIKIVIDDSNNLYISCIYKHCIRKIDASGIIHTIAGIDTTAGYSGDGGPALNAEFHDPVGIAFDHSGNLYIADEENNL